jgi:hypothetical protein
VQYPAKIISHLSAQKVESWQTKFAAKQQHFTASCTKNKDVLLSCQVKQCSLLKEKKRKPSDSSESRCDRGRAEASRPSFYPDCKKQMVLFTARRLDTMNLSIPSRANRILFRSFSFGSYDLRIKFIGHKSQHADFFAIVWMPKYYPPFSRTNQRCCSSTCK